MEALPRWHNPTLGEAQSRSQHTNLRDLADDGIDLDAIPDLEC
jgi:hypothetical protein